MFRSLFRPWAGWSFIPYEVTIQYNTIQYNTIQYNTIQYNTIQYNTIQHNTIQYNTIHHSIVILSFIIKTVFKFFHNNFILLFMFIMEMNILLIWYDMWYDIRYYIGWYDIYGIWYDMIRSDTIRYGIWYYTDIWFGIWYYVIYMIYLLTAIGWYPVAAVQYTYTHKQYIEQHSSQIWKSAGRAPSLRCLPWHLPYSWGKSREKPQSG
jgi:hypothetical protein